MAVGQFAREGAEDRNSSGKKRLSLVDRFHKRMGSRDEKRHSGPTPDGHGGGDPEQMGRRIYCNIPLPESERDEEGTIKASYPRNKIRTSKYTPLSFIPKNLWLQFHTIANIYFLFVIILNFFPIFGGNNPALNAVPLILIIVVTAIKDAIEDWRRTILDNELNNTPVYRLADWSNVNSTEDSVSLWRRFKKACTRALFTVYRKVKSIRRKEAPASSDDESRNSFASERQSLYSPRHSYVAADSEVTAIQMTSVTPSDPDTQFTSPNDLPRTPVRESAASLSRKPGSVVNRLKPTPETARFQRDYWKDIQVGDFVRLYDGDQIPADLVIISSSDPEGTCYLETKNLDGETNLKVRQALHCGHQVRHALDCEKAEFVIESEGPHPNLYAYNGAIRWKQRNEMVEPITINNMLLRGCSLQNTSWVLGLVVFTGAETKIMLNSGVTPSKRPRLAHEMNWNVLYNFAILVIMCLLSGFINGFAWGTHNSSLNWFEYGSYGGSSPVEGLVSFLVGIILFQNLIPIALYISLEIIRTFQALFIYYDSYMVYERLGMGCTPKSWNISDDLGQIEYIFSDKTGTLTQNVMEFKKCTINGMSYGEAYTEAQFGMRKRDGFDATTEAALAHQRIADEQVRMLRMLRDIHNNPYLKDGNLTFIAPDFVSDLQGRSGSNQQKAVESFMVALALCHTVITEHAPGDPPQIEFKAQSPDEAALVATARDCGFTLLGRRGDVLTLNVMGEERTYTVLKTLEFNSTRKRMSVIIQMPDGTVRLFCKGADSIIYSRLTAGQHQQQELQKSTAQHLEMFAREGLRTLCVAERVLDLQEYRAWDELHDLAAQAITNRDEKLEEVANSIEQELTLLGGTAIEDRLQDGVPSTIALLAEAGIKLWVLTGDRVETAINIGFSCNLLNEDMDLLLFNTHTDKPNAEAAAWELEKHLSKFGLTGSDEELIEARLDHSPPIGTHALVIDGDNLKFMLEDDLKQKFLLLCKQCKSVLCCRVSPAQKASVVRMVKDGLKVVALAIGDGANDVAMIQEADIGVGIAGEEGRQAVMCSDYAIGQFRFLQRLIMVHGRWAYRRLGEATANFFYKNLVWTFALFWYSVYNNFDGSYLFDYTYIVLVNVAFTSLPVIFMGIFDQDVSDEVSLAVPQLYMRGIERKEWSQLKFWLYMSDGFYQSLMCFYLPYLLYSPGNFQRSDGLGIDDRPRVGVLVASAAVIASNTYILLNTYRWDWLTVLINALSSLLIFFWTGIYSSLVSSAQFHKSASEVYGTLSYWTVLLVTVMICLLPRFVIKASQKVFFPLDVDIIREQAIMGKFKTVENIDGPTAKAETAYFRLTGSDYSTGPSAVASQDEPRTQETVAMDENHRPTPSFSMNRKLSSINSYDRSSPGTVSPADSMNTVPQTLHSPLGWPYNASSNVV